MDKSLPLWKQYRKEYSVWAQMLDRCRNPNHPQFKYWGGRGIRVCDEWKIFANFLEDMGSRPVGKYSLERRIEMVTTNPIIVTGRQMLNRTIILGVIFS